MTTKQKFKSDAFAAIHSSASPLQKVGGIDQARALANRAPSMCTWSP